MSLGSWQLHSSILFGLLLLLFFSLLLLHFPFNNKHTLFITCNLYIHVFIDMYCVYLFFYHNNGIVLSKLCSAQPHKKLRVLTIVKQKTHIKKRTNNLLARLIYENKHLIMLIFWFRYWYSNASPCFHRFSFDFEISFSIEINRFPGVPHIIIKITITIIYTYQIVIECPIE